MTDLIDYRADQSTCQYIRELLVADPKTACEHIHAAARPGIYRHHRCSLERPRLYGVLGPALLPGTAEWVVECFALFPMRPAVLETRPLLREKNGFLVPVSRKGYCGSRFRFLESHTRDWLEGVLKERLACAAE